MSICGKAIQSCKKKKKEKTLQRAIENMIKINEKTRSPAEKEKNTETQMEILELKIAK